MQTMKNPKIHSEYDFVIVGAGPAGSVIANRLTENENFTVLLIEAGGTENIFHQIPMLAAYLQLTASNWGYKTEPQKNACFGMNKNQCVLPQGKCIGGSTSINYMIYCRGNRRDFDLWAEAGNPGWSYDEILPYFIKSEHSTIKGLENSQYHGRNGPLNVESPPYRTQLVDVFIKASKESGLKEVDYNGEAQLGVSYIQGTTLDGYRFSAAKAFVNPIRNRKNLHIITHSQATKILIDPQTKIATGVKFLNQKKIFVAKARKEVILSAGPIHSPQLLMLSGIGLAKKLQKVNIPIIKELPVGEIMYDHFSFIGPVVVLNSTGNTPRISDVGINDIQDFLQGRGSIFSILGGVESVIFIKLPNSKERDEVPDIELIFFNGSFASDEGTGTVQSINLKREIYNKVFRPLELRDHFIFIIALLHPKSKGKLWLHNRDPLQWPRIDPKYFSDPDDVETILHGIKEALKIIKAPALQKLGARLHDIPLPGCEHIHFASDDYWRCSIKFFSSSFHHHMASCKMGPQNDSTTIVNHELKVHGIRRLRVADSSIIPFPSTGHTSAVSYMIGEKAADMIKASWKN